MEPIQPRPRFLIRSMILYDPVTVAWESLLVLINIGQLLLIWWDKGHAHANQDEALLAATVQTSPFPL